MVGAPVSATLLAASMAASTSLRPLVAMVRVALGVPPELLAQQGKEGSEPGRTEEGDCLYNFVLGLGIHSQLSAGMSQRLSSSGTRMIRGKRSRRSWLRGRRAAKGMW